MKKKILSCLICFTSLFVSYGQTIPNQTIDTIELTSTRIKSNAIQIPAAISVLDIAAKNGIKQQFSIQEYIQPTAGVFVQNASNFAQDARIAIRGFGARAAFGIRGIKLIVDGIPETTPDGQGQLDNLNLGIIDRIEITKGASSSLYGNASGGVVAIETLSYKSFDLDDLKTAATIKLGIGSYGFQNYQATAAVGDSLASYIFHANYVASNGYRDQSGFQQINTNFKGEFKLTDKTRLTAILNYVDAPEADDPGGLTLEEVEGNRRQARDRNILFETGEAITQFKVGASLEWENTQATTFNTYAFYSNRDFNGLLPFEDGGIIDLNRNYLGQGSSVTYKTDNNTLQGGYDFAYQGDDRDRFNNLEGVQGAKSLGQLEQFTNIGIYLIDHWTVDKLFITAGARFDYNKLSADDRFLDNGDDSGSTTLNAFNPSVGVSYAFAKAITPYINFSTSFETPALSELSSNPDGGDGFNESLDAQKATSFEIGVKGVLNNKLRYQIAAFSIDTRDDLVPFELEDFPDREFFRNAGETSRTGIEVEGSYPLLKTVRASISYAYSDFTYEDFQVDDTVFDGNDLPGIAKHITSLGIQYANKKGLSANLTTNLIGSQFADDGNETEIDGYELVNLNASYKTSFREVIIKPYFGINNLLDQEYTDNVRINAFGGRYFEPAAGFNVYGGIVIDL